MTIAELFAAVLVFVDGLLGRIALAFGRTINLVTEGKWSDLVLSDIGIVIMIVFGGLGVLGVLTEGEPPSPREDPRDDD